MTRIVNTEMVDVEMMKIFNALKTGKGYLCKRERLLRKLKKLGYSPMRGNKTSKGFWRTLRRDNLGRVINAKDYFNGTNVLYMEYKLLKNKNNGNIILYAEKPDTWFPVVDILPVFTFGDEKVSRIKLSNIARLEKVYKEYTELETYKYL